MRSLTRRRCQPQRKRTRFGLVTPLGVAILPEMVKPMPTVKQRAFAAVGLPGVVGDGGYRQISRGTWETRRSGRFGDQRLAGIHNRWCGYGRESAGLIVADPQAGTPRRVMPVERRGPTGYMQLREEGRPDWTFNVPLRKRRILRPSR